MPLLVFRPSVLRHACRSGPHLGPNALRRPLLLAVPVAEVGASRTAFSSPRRLRPTTAVACTNNPHRSSHRGFHSGFSSTAASMTASAPELPIGGAAPAATVIVPVAELLDGPASASGAATAEVAATTEAPAPEPLESSAAAAAELPATTTTTTAAAPAPPELLGGTRLKAAFSTAGAGPSFGLWQMLPGANVSRVLARSPGIDWVMVDCEHGNIDDGAMHDAVPAISALGISPIVRIPDLQGWMIKRALDSGAHGILVPLVRTAEEARGIVTAAKFPPLGRRGFGSPLAMERFSPPPSMTEYLQLANDSLLTMVQIETREALDVVEDIAAIPGVDVCFVGPFDLGNNIGHPILNGVIEDKLSAAIKRVLDATHAAGKKCGIFCTSGEQSRHFAEQGFDMISVATDLTALQQTLAVSLATAQGGARPDTNGSY